MVLAQRVAMECGRRYIDIAYLIPVEEVAIVILTVVVVAVVVVVKVVFVTK